MLKKFENRISPALTILTIAILIVIGAGTTANAAARLSATVISTDLDDYAPFDSVVITGSGFNPLEPIMVQVTHHDGLPTDGEGHEPWEVLADAIGTLETFWIVPPDDHVDETLLVVATGMISGLTATALFTDANTVLTVISQMPDTLCAGGTFDVCANLSQPCDGNSSAPLEGREVLFFLNPGNCGANIGQVADTVVLTDANGNACATLTLPSTPGGYAIRVKFLGEDKPGSGDPPNSACNPNHRTKLSASNYCRTTVIDPNYGSAPIVVIAGGNDTTISMCAPMEICLPVSITDTDCDVDSVLTSYGTYLTTVSNFDLIARISSLGGTVYQVGGGAPGTQLYSSSDFVSPLNSQSGVSVTLPDFIFADNVSDYGSFPNGTEPGNSADHLLGAPTDLTFTTAGAGGPDGGLGDGSVAFASGNYTVLDFAQAITVCNGSGSDFVIFTNTNGDGTAELRFLSSGYVVHTITAVLPAQTAGSGTGGLVLDLTDGLVYDAIRVSSISGTVEIDAFAARVVAGVSDDDLCFMADTSGVYALEVTAYDGCGNSGSDQILVTVNLNSAPVANAGADQNLSMCQPAEICMGVGFSDVDGNFDYGELVSGPGSLNGNQICFTPPAAGTYQFVIRAVDDCGLDDFDTVLVTVDLNSPPIANDPSEVTLFQCQPTQLCYGFTATDADADSLSWSLISGVGSITPTGVFCFTPTGAGTYSATVEVSDGCATDTTTIIYHISLNTPPIAADPGGPLSVFQCVPEEICYAFGASDNEGGTLVWSLNSGTGSLSAGGEYCFTPTGAGTYTANVTVTDSCGLADSSSLSWTVSLNDPPVVTMGADTSVSLCATESMCLPYTVSDPQGVAGLIEIMTAGYGAIDTLNNEICFVPGTAGSYQFIVSATDSCGEVGADTIVVDVSIDPTAAITCPVDPIDVFLCDADTVCYALDVTPPGATITTSLGYYYNGEICFVADTSGSYTGELIATTPCGADTCQVTFNVVIGSVAQISCPAPQSLFMCGPGQISIPVSAGGTDVTVTVLPIGTYESGSIIVPVDTAGHYVLTVIASSATCGTDTCQLIADISMNAPPVANNPGAAVDTFMCGTDQICYTFGASDPDGGTLTWSRLSGAGTVSANGNWCFDVVAGGSYTVTAIVTDSCNAVDTVSHTYNVTLNSAPVVTINDDSIFTCAAGLICIPYSLSDVDANALDPTSDCAGGTIDPGFSTLCFVADSSGLYTVCISAIDACGAQSVDTAYIRVRINSKPWVDAGNDQTVFECNPKPRCLPITAGDPDGNLSTVEFIEGPGYFDGSQICFTPTQTYNYEFIVKATDACGLESFDTVAVFYTLNQSPVANAGNDSSLFLCAPQSICIPASCSDPDGNLTGGTIIEGPGTYDGANICFTPTGTGIYTIVLQATDNCNLTDVDTVIVDVAINVDPICNVPNDTVIFTCISQEICLPVSTLDDDGNLRSCTIVSGPGSLVNGNWCYTPVSHQVVTVTVRCEDSCDAYCESQFTVEFDVNGPPTISFGNDTTIFLCASQELVFPYSTSDPDDPRPTTVSLVSGVGVLDDANSQVLFTPASSGTYTLIVGITDECGLTDQDSLTVTVDLNQPPVIDAGADQTLFVCTAGDEICLPATYSDPDGNLDGIALVGPGSWDGSGSQICFNPTGSGSYQFILTATDECGLQDADTVVVDVTINSAPTVDLGADQNLSLCAGSEVCFPYTVDDADGLSGLTETMASGYGSIDTAANEICFTPATAGSYEFVVAVTDSCGATSDDTFVVNVTFGESVTIECPTAPVPVPLCAPGNVTYALTITPAGATVTTSLGTYAGGVLTFYADTSGTYSATVVATAGCGADTCQIAFNVTIDDTTPFTCPDPAQLDLCGPQIVCISTGVINGSVTVSPFGTYSNGTICFDIDTSGHYEFIIISVTDCRNDTCVLVLDVTMNNAPIAVDPATPVDTFVCAIGEITPYQFSADDADGDALTWSRLSGVGTVSSSGDWSFTVTGDGQYCVTAVATDPCGSADTVSLCYNITVNEAPVIAVTPGERFLCLGESTCVVYTVSDANDNLSTVELLTAGTLDDQTNTICFPGDTTGLYRVIVQATDECGAIDVDTAYIPVQINRPPVVDAGQNADLFLCDVGPVCWPASATDPDDNHSVTLTGPGTFDGSQICFTPATDGSYTFILQATDACNLTDADTVTITVTVNSPPVCEVPNDTTIFQCTTDQISLPVTATDVDNNFDHCELLGGPGSIVGGNWVFTPSSDYVANVKVLCIDSCGATCVDSFTVVINVNQAPVADAGNDSLFFLCQPGTEICVHAECSDDDGNLVLCELVSGLGTYDSGTETICFTAGSSEGTHRFILQATDACGLVDADTVMITIQYNDPPTVEGPDNVVAYLEEPGEICVSVPVSDPNQDEVDVSIAQFSGPPVYNSDYVGGQLCFEASSSGEYCFLIQAVDDCSAHAYDTVCVEIVLDECIHVQIEESHASLQGGHQSLDIFLNGSGKELGGFDLLIEYDASALTVGEVLPGAILEGCGWEYFTYRYGADGNCGTGCPSGLLRIVALAEMNNGANHPGCFLQGMIGSIAVVDFLISNDRTLECQFAPVKFSWLGCNDNSLASRNGDTLWISRHVYDQNLNNIANNSYGFPGWFGASDDCLISGGFTKTEPIRCVDFTNGGIDIVCADSIDARGDINLNNVPYEIADVVVYSNYFVYGLSAFNISVAGQTAASDVNADGITLSVGDLVYLIRVVIGDAPPTAKLNPTVRFEAEFDIVGDVVALTRTDTPIGALSMVIGGNARPVLHEDAAGMDMRYNFDGTNTRVLIYNLKGDAFLEAGGLLHLDRSTDIRAIKSIEAGGYNGQVVTTKLNNLPTHFELSQNYPNPFNPTTTLSYGLPVASKWDITIYNVLGQTVEQFSGESEAGFYKLEWDARQYASGLYFYRLRAGQFSATKKMVLLK